ncbi:unnamed protein product [Ceratitis capitata]|uniref:(Mediterranean fruit fly) hypothetical protein n=3 Tax=Ceratitis capitata TaxID=7213 RepID=A0A811UMU1_CERCA|nr:unnamed protein product [Ceratitis capitata]
MDETKVLEAALQNCQHLERSIYESIRLVRRLNIRYNSDWLLKNYKKYMANIWSQYQCKMPETTRSVTSVRSIPISSSNSSIAAASAHKQLRKRSSHVVMVLSGARSSHELCGINRQINYKFIKIKRSMETLIHQIQHAIEIANRQRNFVHLNVNARDSRTRVCCH